MIKFISKTALILALAYTTQLFMPWWGVVIAAGVGSLILPGKGLPAFASGFLAVFILWSAYAMMIDSANEQILSSRVGQLFSVGPSLLVLITGLIGGLCAGFGSWSGNSIRALLKKNQGGSKYH